MDSEPATNSRVIVHVDMDAFYASIEQLDHPEYRGKPVVVGADPRGGRGRGVVSAASYEARAFGIRSAMPISQAYRRCPHAFFVTPRMDRYVRMSAKVMEVLSGFTPLVEPLSIDEAFLDTTGTEKLTGPPGTAARLIKDKILSETRLTASVGVAGNKSVSKIASELGKPDGLVLCPPGREKEFLSTLPLKHLWGAGGKTMEKLASLGFGTIGHVASSSPGCSESTGGASGSSPTGSTTGTWSPGGTGSPSRRKPPSSGTFRPPRMSSTCSSGSRTPSQGT
jgi:nucleotidyltransferase/DNA polymerase involved in DNA repair